MEAEGEAGAVVAVEDVVVVAEVVASIAVSTKDPHLKSLVGYVFLSLRIFRYL